MKNNDTRGFSIGGEPCVSFLSWFIGVNCGAFLLLLV